ncbi:MAG: UDP-N-acetylglucosamine 2-epimerase (non-hydrolyzing) [Dehalococcoidia bacterium]
MNQTGPVMVIAGTRPEVLKLAPVVAALRHIGVPTTLVATGQHSEILERAFDDVQLQPDVRIDVLHPGQALPALIARVLDGIGALLTAHNYSGVVVQGDTASAFGGALAAFLSGLPVFHVEAGLRTNRLDQPFPEEALRQMLSRIAARHFAPTRRAADALVSEGILAGSIQITGNTIVDTLLMRPAPARPADSALAAVPWDTHRVVFMTTHRRESHGTTLRSILQQAVDALVRIPDIAFVITSHPNPAVQNALQIARAAAEHFPGRLVIVEPLTYADVLFVLSHCWLVATDSGGLQEEAPSFRRLVLILRGATERLEGVDAGVARLVGSALAAGIDAVRSGEFAWPEGVPNPYGDGHAGERIAAAIHAHISGTGSG